MPKKLDVTKMGNKPMPSIKHKYVVAWGKYVGSKDYYIKDQLALAEKDNAPENAIYKRSSGDWATTAEIEDPNIVASLTDYVKYLP
jgi:hypothetical protein